MRVLIACEFSGIVRDAFAERGHDAWSCDLLPSEKNGNHIKDDVLRHLDEHWDLMIAHPPCTYLANSGVRWLKERPERWQLMVEAAQFFHRLLMGLSTDPLWNIPRVAVENPIPHKYALEYIGWKYDQIIQPWQFGHPETKATCLWLYNLPKLKATKVVEGRHGRVWKEPPSPERWKNRSRTYQGIAEAMAQQWGGKP